jgi:hypothetical protein
MNRIKSLAFAVLFGLLLCVVAEIVEVGRAASRSVAAQAEDEAWCEDIGLAPDMQREFRYFETLDR